MQHLSAAAISTTLCLVGFKMVIFDCEIKRAIAVIADLLLLAQCLQCLEQCSVDDGGRGGRMSIRL